MGLTSRQDQRGLLFAPQALRPPVRAQADAHPAARGRHGVVLLQPEATVYA